MAMIARIGEGEERVRIRAYTRAVTNLGIAFGTVVAGFALAINTEFAYKTMIALDAVTFFAAAITYLRVPNVKPSLQSNEKFDWSILKDSTIKDASKSNFILEIQLRLRSNFRESKLDHILD